MMIDSGDVTIIHQAQVVASEWNYVGAFHIFHLNLDMLVDTDAVWYHFTGWISKENL